MYLSAFLKQFYVSVQCLDMGIGHTPDMAESDIIGISITTPQRNEAYELAAYFKERGKILISGGAHATHMPDECKERGFDYVIQGAGEVLLVNLLGDLLGRYDMRGNIQLKTVTEPRDIDFYPMPDRDALPVKDYKYFIDNRPATALMTTRGCPYSCSFCAKVTKKFDMQSAERTIKEVMFTYHRYGFEAFMIYDDVFMASKKRLKKIANQLGSCGFAFRCLGRSNILDDKTCQMLKQLGVVEVGIGIESGSDEILKRNLKGTTVKSNTQAVENLHKHHIRAKAFLIVGLPGETHETVNRTAAWIKHARPDDVDISIFQPMPGSAIFADPERWGVEFVYDGQPQWYKGTPGQYQSTVRTKELLPEEIVAYRDALEKEFKSPELLK